jgi:hypothetical protein
MLPVGLSEFPIHKGVGGRALKVVQKTQGIH